MFKNIFKSILFVSFIFCCFSNEYVYGEVENSKIDLIESNLMSVENAYYKDHPDEFIKQKLITKVTQAIGFKKKLAVNLLLLLCDIAILGTVFLSSYKIAEACGVDESNHNNNPKPSLLIACNLTLLSLMMIPAFHVSLYQYIYNNKLYSEKELQSLINILSKYNPNLNEVDFDNYKNCIPTHLKPTFDVLWRIYQKSGEDGLRKEWEKIRETVVGKQIDFKLYGSLYVQKNI